MSITEGLTEPGVLTVGCDASAPMPLHSEDPESVNFCGFEVDLMNYIASRLGLLLRYRSVLWSEIIDQLREGKLDAICTAATITESRKQIVDFSDSYLEYQLAIITKKESAITNVTDLMEKIISIRIATTAEDFLKKNIKAKQIQSFHMNTDVYESVRSGQADATIDDSPIAQWFVRSIPELKIATLIPDTNSQYAIMFRKGNDNLRRAINEALHQMRADGWYDNFYQKWFGS